MINKSTVKLIFPFRYGKRKLNDVFVKTEIEAGNTRFFNYIHPSDDKGVHEHHGVYKYNNVKINLDFNKSQSFDFSPGKNRFLYDNIDSIEVDDINYNDLRYFTLDGISFYEFPTGISFLVGELNFKGNYSIEEISIIINEITDMKKKIKLTSLLKTGEESFEIVEVNSLRFLGEFIGMNYEDVGFFEEKGNNLPKKAHCFSGFLLDEALTDEKLLKELYYLRKLQNANYLINENDLSKDSLEVVSNYKNSYWGIASEATVNISYLSGNEETDKFFGEQLFGNGNNKGIISKNYFYLYLLVLHQRYAFIYYGSESIKLPRLIVDNGIYKVIDQKGERKCNKNELEIIENRQLESENKIAKLLLDYYFHEVSNISSYNRFYSSVFQVLNIEGLKDEVEQQMNAMKTYTSFIGANMDKRSDKRNGRIELLIAMFALLSLMSDLPGPLASVINEIAGVDILAYEYFYSAFGSGLLVIILIVIGMKRFGD